MKAISQVALASRLSRNLGGRLSQRRDLHEAEQLAEALEHEEQSIFNTIANDRSRSSTNDSQPGTPDPRLSLVVETPGLEEEQSAEEEEGEGEGGASHAPRFLSSGEHASSLEDMHDFRHLKQNLARMWETQGKTGDPPALCCGDKMLLVAGMLATAACFFFFCFLVVVNLVWMSEVEFGL